jgi:hypothetical protein
VLKGQIILFFIQTLVDLFILRVVFEQHLVSPLFIISYLLKIIPILLYEISLIMQAPICKSILLNRLVRNLIQFIVDLTEDFMRDCAFDHVLCLEVGSVSVQLYRRLLSLIQINLNSASILGLKAQIKHISIQEVFSTMPRMKLNRLLINVRLRALRYIRLLSGH